MLEALSSSGYTGKRMKKDSDLLLLNSIINDIKYTSIGKKTSKRKTFILGDPAEKFKEIESRIESENESNDLEGLGVKNKIQSKVIDIWTRLEALLRLNYQATLIL